MQQDVPCFEILNRISNYFEPNKTHVENKQPSSEFMHCSTVSD